ncbi:MAG: coproporphyrinogen III oxidase [Pseudomonadota bacterium]
MSGSQELANELPGADKDGYFWASGISLVAHMRPVHVPNIHMNTRMITTKNKSWFGGACDLNPVIPYDADCTDFHQALKKVCDDYDHHCYQDFKQKCDDYFFIKHRNCARGIGGIFFDRLDHQNFEQDFNFVKNVGLCFKNIFPQIVKRHLSKKSTLAQRQQQLEWRGRYVEFNLLYDRGTKFGLMTNANPEAVLMSMPPQAGWGYQLKS